MIVRVEGEKAQRGSENEEKMIKHPVRFFFAQKRKGVEPIQLFLTLKLRLTFLCGPFFQ